MICKKYLNARDLSDEQSILQFHHNCYKANFGGVDEGSNVK